MNLKLFFVYFSILMLLFISCNENERKVELGEKVDPQYSENIVYKMIGSAQVAPVFYITNRNVSFGVSLNKKQEIIYIETTDINFSTENGISLNSKWSNVINLATSKLILEPGWSYY